MNIYILRHGPAGDKEDWAPKPDHLRPLTGAGKKRVKQVAKEMRRMGLSFNAILTSPYERALATAKIAAKVLGLKGKLTQFAPLVPGGNLKELLRELGRHRKSWEDVLLVGHEPALSQLIALITTGKSASFLDLKKAGLAKLASDRPRPGACAVLDYLLPPKLIL